MDVLFKPIELKMQTSAPSCAQCKSLKILENVSNQQCLYSILVKAQTDTVSEAGCIEWLEKNNKHHCLYLYYDTKVMALVP